MSTPVITQAILDGIEAAAAEGRDPLVILDLDGTLYDNTHRTLRILQEFAHTHAVRRPELYRKIANISTGDTCYKMADTLAGIGIHDDAIVREVQAFWFQRFFTNEYVLYDLPLAGAVEFVQVIHEAGGVPTYLTGRDAPNMLQGTITALQRDGFPVGRIDTRTVLKQDFETPDNVYKRSVISHFRKTGRVVASFDNEPGLCNMFKEAFPEATVVWLDTSHAPGAPALSSKVHTISDFTEVLSAS